MMIQDVLAIADAGPRAEDVLETLRVRIAEFERFECGELLAWTDRGLSRFVIAKGLGESAGAPLLEALDGLGPEKTLRLDTAAEIKERGLPLSQGLSSVLILRVEARGARSAAIVLGHSRAWSFAAAPLSRIRTLGNVALRLALSQPPPAPVRAPASPDPEVARLRAHVGSLESEIVTLRAERASKKRSGKPQ